MHDKRRPPRGFFLLYGLLVLGVVLGAIFVLASAASSRAQTERLELQRETALRTAESALEEARSAVAAGNLKAGASQNFFNNTPVTCTAAGNGLQLEALVALSGTAATPAAPKHPHQAVSVRWTLKNGAAKPAAPAWSIAEWHIQNETLR